jgi:hypothetical protein
MEKNIRIAYAEFNKEASQIFFSVFNEFRNEADKIVRDGYENVYQIARAKYLNILKYRLDLIAGSFIDQSSTSKETQGHLRNSFSENIKYFLKEFERKSEYI